MSTACLEQAWDYVTADMVDKLLLVALSELADRDGMVIFNVSAIVDMTGVKPVIFERQLLSLSLTGALAILNKNGDEFAVRLTFGQATIVKSPSPARQAAPLRPQMPPMYQRTNPPSYVRLSNLDPQKAPDWMHDIMFTSLKCGGDNSVWAEFLAHVRSDRIMKLNEFLESFKRYLRGRPF